MDRCAPGDFSRILSLEKSSSNSFSPAFLVDNSGDRPFSLKSPGPSGSLSFEVARVLGLPEDVGILSLAVARKGILFLDVARDLCFLLS